MGRLISWFNKLLNKPDLILTTALRLFVANGFHVTPTSKIAAEAGIANGTLFHYYKTKEHLIIALYNKLKTDLAGVITEVTKRDDFVTIKFRNMFIQSVLWALSNRDKFYYIQQFNFSPHFAKVPPEVLAEHAEPYTSFITAAVHKKLMTQQPTDLIMALFNGQVYGVCQYLSVADFEPADRDRTIATAYNMLWDMLKYM